MTNLKKASRRTKYAKDLLDNKNRQGEPEFSKEVADKFFKSTYRDKKRQYRYNPLKGIPKAKPPKQNFTSKPPTYEELAEIVRNKRNNSAPVTNAVPYLVHKKCPQVLAHILPIFKRIWKKKQIPLSWRVGEAVLVRRKRTEPNRSCLGISPWQMWVGRCSSKYWPTDYCRTWLGMVTSTNQYRRDSYRA